MPLPLLMSLAVCLLSGACSDRPRRNPLDPLAQQADSQVRPLTAVSGNGRVVLRWDYSWYHDLQGYRIYRRVGRGSFGQYPARDLGPEVREYTDQSVENGRTYEYQLALLVSGESEQRLAEIRRATPGPQIGWAADRSTGLVWRISPDGRSAWFGQGRFGDLAGVAPDLQDSSCWVSDRFYRGLYRLLADGTVEPHPGDLRVAGELSVDPEGRLAWVVDQDRRQVRWFALPAADTLLLVEVDASFVEPAGLDAREGSCWISDRPAGRVLLYDPAKGHLDEWRGLVRPGSVSGGSGGTGWVLVRDGRGLARLDQGGQWRELVLPFTRAVALEGEAHGGCWVLGENGLALLDPSEGLQGRWEGLPDCQDLAVDPEHHEVWVAAGGVLLKLASTGETLARLEGFSGLWRVAVDPGRP